MNGLNGLNNGEDTDNNSSITTDTTAQMPVPLQRNMPNRRNEYVNMPVNNHPMPQTNDQNSISSASPDLSHHNHAPPLPPHNYANMPINKNPLPPPRTEEPPQSRRTYNFNRQSRYQNIESDQEPLSYNDTQTLRADQKLEYPPPPKEELRSNNGFSDSTDSSAKPQFRQLHLDYGGGNNGRSESRATTAEPQQATRIPTGHARRENRASLRAKHRRDMEQQQAQAQAQAQATGVKPKKPAAQLPRDEDDYGFSKGAAALPNGNHHGNHQNRDPNQDKWYLHDSMRPVGAPQHGGNCKCYRCQRKLTAI